MGRTEAGLRGIRGHYRRVLALVYTEQYLGHIGEAG